MDIILHYTETLNDYAVRSRLTYIIIIIIIINVFRTIRARVNLSINITAACNRRTLRRLIEREDEEKRHDREILLLKRRGARTAAQVHYIRRGSMHIYIHDTRTELFACIV